MSNTVPAEDEYSNIPWMTVATKEKGVQRIAGPTHNSRILEYHSTTTLQATTDEIAWCSSFVNWCLKQVGIHGSNSALAVSWLKWGQEVPPGTVGAITVIYFAKAAGSRLTTSGNHVGFLAKETPTHITLLGGNQHDQVKVSTYPKTSWHIKGYRWPEWMTVHDTTSTPKSDQEPCKIIIRPLVVE